VIDEKAVPAAIETGLRSLATLHGCVVEDRPTPAGDGWIVRLSLEAENADEFVPAKTRWCVRLDDAYPAGSIAFYPASVEGLAVTFPHQERNEADRDGRGYRGGKLCLDSPFRGERLRTAVRDPFGDAEGRLRWHVERALTWLDAAATGTLLAPGDPFEVPARPRPVSLEGQTFRRVVHDETSSTFGAWAADHCSTGPVRFGVDPGLNGVLVAGEFTDSCGRSIRTWTGRQVETWADDVEGVWWLWPRPVVVPPWHSPGTWGELRAVGRIQGVDVDALLKQLASRRRGAKTTALLLLGYPIPTRVGEAPCEVHWEAVVLPKLRAPDLNPPHGFRPNAAGWWHRDRRCELADDKPLNRVPIENWGPDRLQARGRLPPVVRDARVMLIGTGALGATVGELIVRAGVSEIGVLDGDRLEAGNVSRHPATLADIGAAKATAVALRLKQMSPHVKVTALPHDLPADQSALVATLDAYHVIVDCTGADEVLFLLAEAWWPVPKVFASFSLGYAGRRLFAFGAIAHQFPDARFKEMLAPWLADEAALWSANEEVLEGAGCWSPLFPARADDVMLAAAMCVKELEHLVATRPHQPRLRVFEQQHTPDGLAGFLLQQLSADDQNTE
jgi:hypothetical protein